MGSWREFGMPIDGHVDIMGAVELVRRLYVDLREGTGGPLHIILDDDNTDDHWVEQYNNSGECFEYLWDGSFERYASAGEDVSEAHRQAIQDTCKGILHAFAEMTEAERVCVLAWYEGRIEKELPDWYAKHRTPAHLEDARERADKYVHDALAVKQGVDPIAKSCISIPCPPFEDFGHSELLAPSAGGPSFTPIMDAVLASPRVDPADLEALQGDPAWERVQRAARAQLDEALGMRPAPWFETVSPGVQDAWAIAHTETTSLPEQLANAPQWQKDAWAKAPDVLRKMLLTGEARLIQFHHETPQVDVEQILLEDAGRPPKVLYRGPSPGVHIHEMLERWLADPKGTADNAPMIVGVPEGVDAAQLTSAIALCQQAGLLPMTGILLMPAELEGNA